MGVSLCIHISHNIEFMFLMFCNYTSSFGEIKYMRIEILISVRRAHFARICHVQDVKGFVITYCNF